MQKFIGSILCIALLLAGVCIRTLGGIPLLNTEMIYAPQESGEIPEANSPANTVKRFYMLFDRGLYAKAWEISVEPDWSNGKKVSLK